MADSVSNKQSNKRLAKESKINNNNLSLSSSSSSSSSKQTKVAINSTIKADSLELSSAAAAAIDIDIVEGEEGEEVTKRVKIQRKAKSIAKEAITSILIPHYNNSTVVDSKIDQSTNIEQRDRSKSSKRRRRSSDLQQPSTSNQRRSTRNSIPNKKAKLNISSSSSSSPDSSLNRKKSIVVDTTTTTTDISSSISTSTATLGNTCNIRSKETTGGCVTRPSSRRSSQQHQQPQQADLQETTVAAATSQNRRAQTKNKSGGKSLNNMNSNVNNNNNSSTTTSTVAGTTTATTATFSSLFGGTTTTTAAAANPQTSNTVPPSTAAATGPYTFPISESESDDNADFSRLTDILQARGLPSHIVNAFGNKVQQFLSRTMSSGVNGRSQQLMQSLQQSDETLKLTGLTELCQLLVMGNEDTLAGFPIKQAVPLLLQCMNSESNNYDLMNHACRALTYMMESLPRSSSIIAEGIPIFLEKLQIIQCMDVAEQALIALEILSRRNSKQILHSNGIAACLTYIDFFSITAQRNALQITANCCQNMIKEEFIHIQSVLSILAQRLTHSDKKSVESVCMIFSRLVENFQRDQTILKEIASHNVLPNLQQLLVVQPQLISSAIFVLVLHTMHLMCINCTELAVELLENSIADTLKYLLIGPSVKQLKQQSTANQIDLVSRPPQELYEIASLISEMLPKLPSTGIFQIDDALKKSSSNHQTNHIYWQWKDEREIWRPYTPIDSRIIEAAFLQEEDEVSLSTMGRTYVVDFNTMLQINEDTGTTRPVLRKIIGSSSSTAPTTTTTVTPTIQEQPPPPPSSESDIEMSCSNETVVVVSSKKTIKIDHRLDFLNKNSSLHADFVRSLFAILYEVYSSSAGPAIKHRCLRAILRMIFYTDSPLLNDVLKNLTISSHISSILASQDLKIIVCALQICEILMEKLPNIFSIYFHREGVIHQIDRLIDTYNNNAQPLKTSLLIEEEGEEEEEEDEEEEEEEEIPSTILDIDNNNMMITSQTFPNLFTPTASAMWPYSTTTTSTTLATPTTTANAISSSSLNNTPNNNSYKLTPFGVDTIIGDTLNNDVIIQPTTSSKAESKFVETLKRKVKTPKRSGRKSNKNELLVNTPTTATASNYDQTNEDELAPKGVDPATSTSNYVQNVISKINNPNRLNSTAAAAAAKPSTQQQPMYMSLYPSATSTTATPVATTTTTSRSNDFSIFGSQLWNHLRGASSLMTRSTTTASTSKQTSKLQSPNSSLTPSFQQQRSSKKSGSLPQSSSSSQQLIDFNTINFNKEKVRQWIYEQAKRFKEKYFSTSTTKVVDPTQTASSHPGLSILKRLNTSVCKLSISSSGISLLALKEISDIIYETDISSFEMIHSGLITKLLDFLTLDGGESNSKCDRLRQFLHIFANLPLLETDDDTWTSENKKANLLANLISKLHNCVNQLEQFAVRVHDVPNSIGYGKTAIKFFNTHQLKCLLQRHNDATTIRQWKGGPVKVDPLAVVSAIEKYLVMRGMNKSPQSNDSDDSENSDDDIEEAMSAILGRASESNGPRLELMINDHPLPSNITIYQAIKQFALHTDTDNETDNESFANNEIWSKVHTIVYRLQSTATAAVVVTTNKSNIQIPSAAAPTTTEKRTTRTSLLSALSSATTSSTISKSTSSKRASTNDIINSQLISNTHFLDHLNNTWKKELTISDLSIDAISLLRILNCLNRNWYLLYNKFSKYAQIIQHYAHTTQSFMINASEFVNSKIAAKANRQLQDPLVIMTGHLPKWLPELIKSCAYLFPFETRLMFFYASSFDRDRAMQKLLDSNTEMGNNTSDGANSSERLVPKLERKKKTIIRDSDIFKQSETILNELGKSKALLEIQYENEVGTGLGPTLEFYALVSLEMQKVDYELWRGEKIKISTATGANQNSYFFYSPNGLFPAPLAKNAKQHHVNKIRNKFKFFGKFVAKAIMDFRILDIQLSVVFHKWLIDQTSLNDYDIKYVDSVLYRSMESLKEYSIKHKALVNKQLLCNKESVVVVDVEISNLDKAVRELDLDFTLPGYSSIELKKNGKDILVNLYNLEDYLKLITQWTLIDGVQRQFESFKEGFNSIFPITSLNQFYPEELERLFCGSGYDIWESKLLIECTRCDHGYTHDSKAVQFLFEILASYTSDEQRLFLQFVTGSPRLPVGGLRSLTPQLTIVRKTIEGNDNPDNYLPSVMTCVNYLKLPEYTNVDIMREKLHKAMTEGQLSFNLS